MKSKLKFIVPVVLLLVLGGVYKFVLAKPAAEADPPKVQGEVYVLPSEFTLNLADGKYVKLGVGLIMEHGAATAAAGGHGAAAEPPEGYGSLAQEAIVRDIVTDEVTEADSRVMATTRGRDKLKQEILQRIHEQTDVHAESVLFTDVTVQ
jgi:flagellar protein FliL